MKPSPENFAEQTGTAENYCEWGRTLARQGKVEEAIVHYKLALKKKPNLAAGHNDLGILLAQQGKQSEAISHYQLAIKFEPSLAEAHNNLGNSLAQAGERDQAVACYTKALDLRPDYHQARFSQTIAQLPIIYADQNDIEQKRHQYQQHLDNLVNYYQETDSLQLEQASETVGLSLPFYLAYQGLNDRQLQQVHGSLAHHLMNQGYPQWSIVQPLRQLNKGAKVRVGFISGFFHHHSVWKIPLRGWIENLDRSEFELFGYYTSTTKDFETKQAAQAFDYFEHQNYSLEQWAEKIASDQLDILVFSEFGMDTMAFKLGCLRLAPVQMTTWGHPDTSGLPSIDYYLSSELMETAQAQSHYTEQLVRLPNLGIAYRPILIRPEPTTKEDLGLQQEDIMFWCCQSLFKYLPQHDDIFPQIAQKLGQAKFVFIKLDSELATNIFRQRLAQVFRQYGLAYQDYCIFLPRMMAETFNGVTAIADVFLDNIGWSGCNTTLECLAHNLPVVTLPGEMMRSRHTFAFLKMIGLEETIAVSKEQYVNIAVRLGQDAQYRHTIAQQIAKNKHKLYEDLQPVRALENFFLKVVGKPRKFDDQNVASYFQSAEQLRRKNHLPEAQEEYLKVLSCIPDHPEALYGLGEIALKNNQLELAESYLNRVLKIRPDFTLAWFNLGNLYHAQERLDSSEAAYRQALKFKSDAVPILNNLAYVLQKQEKYPEAIAYFQEALKLQPECVEADVNLANIFFVQEQLSAAQIAHYARLNYNLGLNLYRFRQWQVSTAYFRQAVLMQPEYVDALYYLGLALYQQRELSESLSWLQQVLVLAPEKGQAYYHIGQIYQDLGDLGQATVNFQGGLKLTNAKYAEALEEPTLDNTFAENFQIPQVPQGSLKIGNYDFPAIPAVIDPEQPRPFWSVVIPVVNRPEFFPECLASVLAQWDGQTEMEIIVLDNGSNPPLWKIPEELGLGIIKYYRFSETISLQENWNTAVSLCRGHWIHLLHHDDYVLPEFYARLKTGLETAPESVGAAFVGYENINEERQVIFSQLHNLGNQRGIVPDWIKRIGVSCSFSPPSLVIRRDAYEQLGGYKLDLLYTCDWELYKRIASFYDWWYEPGILAHYREQANSITISENVTGASGEAHRQAIKISSSYLPQEYEAEITAQSLKYHFQWCLQRSQIPLGVGNLDGVLNLVKEALKMDSSPEAIAYLKTWLKQNLATNMLSQLTVREFNSDPQKEIVIQLAQDILNT